MAAVSVRRRPKSSSSAKEHGCGVYFYPYILELYRRRQITFRGALLLAAVDYHINSWKGERMKLMYATPESVLDDDEKPCTEVVASTRKIRELLQCDDPKTVRATIENLASVRPVVFKAVKIKRGTWKMKTRPNRGAGATDGVYAKPLILDLWRSGRLGGKHGWGVLMLAGIDAFERNGKRCFVTNRTISRWCGVSTRKAKSMVRYFKSIGVLEATYVRKGNRTRRYLHVAVDSKPPIYLYNDEGEVFFADDDIGLL